MHNCACFAFRVCRCSLILKRGSNEGKGRERVEQLCHQDCMPREDARMMQARTTMGRGEGRKKLQVATDSGRHELSACLRHDRGKQQGAAWLKADKQSDTWSATDLKDR